MVQYIVQDILTWIRGSGSHEAKMHYIFKLFTSVVSIMKVGHWASCMTCHTILIILQTKCRSLTMIQYLSLQLFISEKSTHVWKLHILFFFFMQMQGKMTSLFNDESLDVYKYQTLHDYNPIINKLMIQMAIGSSTLMKEMLQGRTEMFNMNAFTEVLYKKKKTIIEWWTQ